MKTKKFILLVAMMIGGLSAYGQSFMYSYIDPCTGNINTLMYDMSSPLIVSYYGETQSFTPLELQNGTFDAWLNQVYANYQASPCQGVLVSTTQVSSTNLTTNVVQAVLNLNTIVSLGSIDIDVGSTTDSGTDEISGNENENEENNSANSTSGSSTSSNSSSSSSSEGSGNGQSGSSSNGSDGSGSSNSGSSSSNEGGNSGSSGSDSGSSGSGSSGDGSSGDGGNSSGGTNGGSTQNGTGDRTDGQGVREGESQEGGSVSEEEATQIKEDQQKNDSQQASKSTAKAKAKTQKPAILMTGDIVGLQKTEDNSNDARGTFSFTRVKGDGTASLGLSADYMVRARIANVTLMKSWIGTDEKGHKHINLISSGLSVQPDAWSNTNMYIRVNSLEKFTSIYGAAASYGVLYEEDIVSTLLIGGFMYKGLVVRKVEATIIAAGVYSPYTKYYTETWWNNMPIVIPFFNFNYKVTKTFGMGITGGGTYQAGADVVNYQVLMGAKLIL